MNNKNKCILIIRQIIRLSFVINLRKMLLDIFQIRFWRRKKFKQGCVHNFFIFYFCTKLTKIWWKHYAILLGVILVRTTQIVESPFFPKGGWYVIILNFTDGLYKQAVYWYTLGVFHIILNIFQRTCFHNDKLYPGLTVLWLAHTVKLSVTSDVLALQLSS